MKLTIISGRSGSGKSVCLHVLEDMGFYCIDNLPVGLLPVLSAEVKHHDHVAISIDGRNLAADLNRFGSLIKELSKTIHAYQIIFLDAEDNTLLRRFSETRRKHPLSSEHVSLQEALQQETYLLHSISEHADLRIDTSLLTVSQLRELIRQRLNPSANPGMSLLFESFGYKFGVPADADYTFDVRCLPNPYWEPSLRNYTGLDVNVQDFLQQQPITQHLLNDIKHFLTRWLPQFAADNRNYMTIAVGCTGGQHRSVYIVEQLAKHFRELPMNVQTRHREI